MAEHPQTTRLIKQLTEQRDACRRATDAVVHQLNKTIAERDELLSVLKSCRAFIQSEYEMPIMQGHYEGHHIASEARPLWEILCGVLAKHMETTDG